jgi:hypothetical protein
LHVLLLRLPLINMINTDNYGYVNHICLYRVWNQLLSNTGYQRKCISINISKCIFTKIDTKQIGGNVFVLSRTSSRHFKTHSTLHLINAFKQSHYVSYFTSSMGTILHYFTKLAKQNAIIAFIAISPPIKFIVQRIKSARLLIHCSR